MQTSDLAAETPAPLTSQGRFLILAAAFLGWLFAGPQMAIMPLVNRSVTISLLWPLQGKTPLTSLQQPLIGQWMSINLAAFLFGAAAGGLLLGWMDDRAGPTRAMGLSILLYTLPCGLAYLVEGPWQFTILRFLC